MRARRTEDQSDRFASQGIETESETQANGRRAEEERSQVPPAG
jgi:hypothetical protein